MVACTAIAALYPPEHVTAQAAKDASYFCASEFESGASYNEARKDGKLLLLMRHINLCCT